MAHQWVSVDVDTHRAQHEADALLRTVASDASARRLRGGVETAGHLGDVRLRVLAFVRPVDDALDGHRVLAFVDGQVGSAVALQI